MNFYFWHLISAGTGTMTTPVLSWASHGLGIRRQTWVCFVCAWSVFRLYFKTPVLLRTEGHVSSPKMLFLATFVAAFVGPPDEQLWNAGSLAGIIVGNVYSVMVNFHCGPDFVGYVVDTFGSVCEGISWSRTEGGAHSACGQLHPTIPQGRVSSI